MWINNGRENRHATPAEMEVFLGSGWLRGRIPVTFGPYKTHCKHGHEYTEANTYHHKGSNRRSCRACMKQKKQERYKANPDEWKDWRKRNPEKALAVSKNAKWKYRGINITVERYDQLFREQRGLCALCGQPPADAQNQRLVPDHDHGTGVIRGLIHGSCNLLLGNAKDSPELLDKAASYLRKTKLGATDDSAE